MLPNHHHSARSISDEELVLILAAFRSGDRDAFRSLYDQFHSKIYRFCRRMTNDDALAKDAFQETFIRMYEHRRELRGDNVRSWLFSIARRTCLNLLRTRRASHEPFDETFHAHPDVVDHDVILKERIEQALTHLPIALREALVLREYEGHSYQEIADIVGIDLSLAKVRVYRARLMMRKLLAPVLNER